MQDVKLIEVKQDILTQNKELAEELRNDLTREKTFLLNLMSSPGAGKTSLIQKTIEQLQTHFKTGIIEADIDSMVDSEKIASLGTSAIQLRTGGFCHLDASMLKQALQDLQFAAFDLIIVENIGNLVCPAEFDIGAIKNAMILSVPEGDDKPLKYPAMFKISDVVLVNKIDYMQLTDFDTLTLKDRIASLNSRAPVIELSCRTEQGLQDWIIWLKKEINEFIQS